MSLADLTPRAVWMGTRPIPITYRGLRLRIRHIANDFLIGIVNRVNTCNGNLPPPLRRKNFADFNEALFVRYAIDHFLPHVKGRFTRMRGRRSDLGHVWDSGLIAEPSWRRKENKRHNEGANHVVLPDSSLIVPQNETSETGGHSPQCINRENCAHRSMVVRALLKSAGVEMTKIFPFRCRTLCSTRSG